MRKSRVLLAGVAVAAAAAATSAFTASNDFTAPNNAAGYGAVAATGVTVSNIHYDLATGDVSKIQDVVFTVDKDTTGESILMTLGTTAAPTTPVTGSTSTCNPGGETSAPYTITCTLGTALDMTTFTNTALTVTSK